MGEAAFKARSLQAGGAPARSMVSRRFVVVIGLAIALHAVVLSPWRTSATLYQSGPRAVWMTARLVPSPVDHQVMNASEPVVTAASGDATSTATPSRAQRQESSLAATGKVDSSVATPPPADDRSSKAASRTPSAQAPAQEREAEFDNKPAAPQVAAAPSVPAPRLNQLPPAPDYRAGGSLDPGPKPIDDINPVYPARAGQQHGVVVLRLLINESGAVDNVAVVRSSPYGYFEQAAIDAFGPAHFAPGMLLGMPVKSQITIEVEFTPINRGAGVSGSTY